MSFLWVLGCRDLADAFGWFLKAKFNLIFSTSVGRGQEK